MTLEPQLAVLPSQERGARQLHRAGTDAAEPGAWAWGRVKGPFCPQPAPTATTPDSKAVNASLFRRTDTLLEVGTCMRRIL